MDDNSFDYNEGSPKQEPENEVDNAGESEQSPENEDNISKDGDANSKDEDEDSELKGVDRHIAPIDSSQFLDNDEDTVFSAA